MIKRLFPFLFITFLTNVLFAQTENYKTVIENFQQNYNNNEYDQIFNAFSPEMQKALPLENTKQFLMGLKTQTGKIQNKEFISYGQGAYATYKTKFEKAVLAVNISLDGQNKINGLFVKPYEEPGKIESKTVNALNYPREIAEIIYSKSKDFPNNTQISIAIIQNGKTNYYGIIKENDSIKPVENQNNFFEIGSVTKVFTSTVLASLVERKKIKLTDDINAYYPFTFKNNIKISFESLANHTSGLPRLPENLDLSDEANPYSNYGKNELDEYLKNLLKLENEPLKTYSYSNLGTGLLGYTLGLSQKTTFQKLLQKEVFDKYRMTNSVMNAQNLENKLVKGLNVNGETVSNWDFDVLFAAGGILSTTADLAKFANGHFNSQNKEFNLTRNPTFVVSKTMKIGLGWHILQSEHHKELIWHNGGTGGYSSSMALNINDKKAVIVLSNVPAFNPKMENVDKLCFELIKE